MQIPHAGSIVIRMVLLHAFRGRTVAVKVGNESHEKATHEFGDPPHIFENSTFQKVIFRCQREQQVTRPTKRFIFRAQASAERETD